MSVTRYSRADRARQEWLELYAHALTVECPRCGQLVDEPCLNPLTGEQLAAPAHPQRITRADHAARDADRRAQADRSTSCDPPTRR